MGTQRHLPKRPTQTCNDVRDLGLDAIQKDLSPLRFYGCSAVNQLDATRLPINHEDQIRQDGGSILSVFMEEFFWVNGLESWQFCRFRPCSTGSVTLEKESGDMRRNHKETIFSVPQGVQSFLFGLTNLSCPRLPSRFGAAVALPRCLRWR